MDISKDIIERAARGEIPAFEEIYKSSSGFVYNVALRISASEHEASEITQDVFVKLFSGLKSFNHKSSFNTWLYRVAVNEALNRRKKSNLENSRRAEFDESVEANPALREDPVGKSVNENIDKDKVAELLSLVNEEHRVVLVLREMQGLNY